MTTKKTKETEIESGAENSKVTLLVIGACRVRIGGENFHFEDEVEIDEVQLKEKGIQYLFANKLVEFLDDSKRTKEFIKSITENQRKRPELSMKERETGADYK